MKGYKAFNNDLTCKGMQYEIGKTYEMDDFPVCCVRGFHFCKNIVDVYKFYPVDDNTRICEVDAIGEITTNDNVKFCTNRIAIVKEIEDKGIKHCNVDGTDVGFLNSGNYNSGNYNSGNYNSGDRNSGFYNNGDRNSGFYNSGLYNSGDFNSGDRNSGERNSGDRNSGDRNSGDFNSGDFNSGDRNNGFYNSGDFNSGDRNSGFYNSGNYNSGFYNSGNYNSGDRNSGDFNSGDYNSGDHNNGFYNSGDFNSGDRNSGFYNSGNYNSGFCNSGNYNSGDFNSGDRNSGYCNTNTPKVRLFNHDTEFDFDSKEIIRLKRILSRMPQSCVYSNYILETDMTDEEKEKHPEHKTIGGYIKIIKVGGNKWKWWNKNVSEDDKEFIRSLPYYDEDIFFESTGIKADMKK